MRQKLEEVPWLCYTEGPFLLVDLQDPLLYLKPVQTGFPEDSDAALVVSHNWMPCDHLIMQAHLCCPASLSSEPDKAWLIIRTSTKQSPLHLQASASSASVSHGRHAAEIAGDNTSVASTSGRSSSVEAWVQHAWRLPASPHLAVSAEGNSNTLPYLPPMQIEAHP